MDEILVPEKTFIYGIGDNKYSKPPDDRHHPEWWSECSGGYHFFWHLCLYPEKLKINTQICKYHILIIRDIQL
jgi:hypothetical protein